MLPPNKGPQQLALQSLSFLLNTRLLFLLKMFACFDYNIYRYDFSFFSNLNYLRILSVVSNLEAMSVVEKIGHALFAYVSDRSSVSTIQLFVLSWFTIF